MNANDAILSAAVPTDPRHDPTRVIRAPRGSQLTCKNWLIEAAYRMIQNNLDPEVAENPDALVVYGGIGKAARNWDSFDAILQSLRALDERVMQLLAEVDLQAFAQTLAIELPYGRKRALELATTLALDPVVLLLDEPTQGMGGEDVDMVVALVRRAAKNRTVLMVEHNLSVVSRLCDRITVLARGAILAEGDYDSVSANPQVREAYMGSEAAAVEASA